MQAWLKIRRNQAILGGLIVVLLAAAYFLVRSWQAGRAPTGPVALAEPGRERSAAREPGPGSQARRQQQQVHHGADRSEPVPVRRLPAGDPVSARAGPAARRPDTVSSNGLYAGGAETNVAGHSVMIHSTYKRGGTTHAQMTVDDTTYAPAVGQRFAGNFKLVSAGGGCAASCTATPPSPSAPSGAEPSTTLRGRITVCEPESAPDACGRAVSSRAVDFARRIDRLRAELPELEADAFLATSLANVRYLTGFTGSNGQVLLSADRGAFFTDGRYERQAAHEVAGPRARRLPDGASPSPSPRCAGSWASPAVAFEADDVTVSIHAALGRAGVELVPTRGVVERLRWMKEAAERALLGEAQAIADQTFDEITGRLREGRDREGAGARHRHDHAPHRGGRGGVRDASWRSARARPSPTTRRATGPCAAATWSRWTSGR